MQWNNSLLHSAGIHSGNYQLRAFNADSPNTEHFAFHVEHQNSITCRNILSIPNMIPY